MEAHADERGSKPFNQDLSERRVERIKDFLVEQGISADKVQTAAYGKDQPLEKETVATLEQSNPKARLQSAPTEEQACRLARVQPARGYHSVAVGKEVDAVLPARRRRLRPNLADAETSAEEGSSGRVTETKQCKKRRGASLSGAFLFMAAISRNKIG